jgi:hypothetical protein
MFNWGSVFKTQQMCFYSSSDTVFVFMWVSGKNTSSSPYTSQYFVAFSGLLLSLQQAQRGYCLKVAERLGEKSGFIERQKIVI